jgi:DNA-binding NtrC family response regulator
MGFPKSPRLATPKACSMMSVNSLQGELALPSFVGRSPLFTEAVRCLPRIARDRAAVLIEGETGTGKELVARALHYVGPRAGFPFAAVNCGALPDTLLEDELFGHERGAFTDAHGRREGLIAQADKGTLFLDEIDGLSRKAQVSLLRVLQEGRYRPVGSSEERFADVRVVAATNARLEGSVEQGSFRSDMFYRLCVFHIQLPPLRERPEDVPLLAMHFLQKHALDNEPPVLSPEALAVLSSHDWPGNARELENVMIRASRLCGGGRIEAEDLQLRKVQPLAETGPQSFQTMKEAAVRNFERGYLRQLMAAHQGNVTRAARTAGKDRRELGKLLKKHQIDPRAFLASASVG